MPGLQQITPFVMRAASLNPATTPFYPTMHINDTATLVAGEEEYTTVTLDKATTPTSALSVVFNGSAVMQVGVENIMGAKHTYRVRWPWFAIDTYVLTAPTDNVDGYIARSTKWGPYEVMVSLGNYDGSLDFNGTSGLYLPDPKQAFLVPCPVDLTVNITDASTLAAFDGASGQQNIYFKPRMGTPIVERDNEGEVGINSISNALVFSIERFVGKGNIYLTR